MRNRRWQDFASLDHGPLVALAEKQAQEIARLQSSLLQSQKLSEGLQDEARHATEWRLQVQRLTKELQRVSSLG
jgi:hypothetical protein